jgi:dTDP-4-amino-4,6-dideoxygalactose transaminase
MDSSYLTTKVGELRSKIWLSAPHMSGLEQQFVNEAFHGNWIAPLGPNVDEFEIEIAEFLEEDIHVVALSSGTAAIHLALILLGVERYDEVICQSFTFSASANPIVYQGATPVFVDSEHATWNISPEHLQYAIEKRLSLGKKVKAIIVVDLYGMPARMKEVFEIANKYEIPVIEDGAEAFGSTYLGKKTCTFGEFSCISFNGNKIITTSGGGALLCKNKQFADKARFLATQARDAAPHYQHSQIGYNYRMSNICAGIGRGQLLVLGNRIEKRREIFSKYRNVLQQYPGIGFQSEPRLMLSNRWLTTILLDPRFTPNAISNKHLRDALATENIESRPLWKPMHLQPVFRDAPYYGEGVCDELFEKGICLPSGSNMSDDDLSRVINKIRSVFV